MKTEGHAGAWAWHANKYLKFEQGVTRASEPFLAVYCGLGMGLWWRLEIHNCCIHHLLVSRIYSQPSRRLIRWRAFALRMARMLNGSLSQRLLIFPALFRRRSPGADEQWVTYKGCRYLPNAANDGDSFHVRRRRGGKYIFRLYFVDAPETDIQHPLIA